MPECLRCERVQVSAEVRRTTRGHVCKDRAACARRARILKADRRAENLRPAEVGRVRKAAEQLVRLRDSVGEDVWDADSFGRLRAADDELAQWLDKYEAAE